MDTNPASESVSLVPFVDSSCHWQHNTRGKKNVDEPGFEPGTYGELAWQISSCVLCLTSPIQVDAKGAIYH